MLSYIYLGRIYDIVVILDLKLETKIGKKEQVTIYKGNLILDSLKGILRW